MTWLKAKPERYPVIDAEYLSRLAALLGSETMAELLADGLIEVADRIDRVEALAEAGDRAGVARIAHDLVGIAGHLGLTQLSIAAGDLQEVAGRSRPSLLVEAEVLTALARPALDALRERLTECG